MRNTNSTTAVRRARRTRQARDEFAGRFGRETIQALAVIRRQSEGRRIPAGMNSFSTASLAAYRANLTRGVYDSFVKVSASGRWTDKLNLLQVR